MAKLSDVSQPRDKISLSVTVGEPMPGIVLCGVRGEIDLSTEALLREELPSTGQLSAHHLVIDLSDVQFLGSAGLSVLLEVQAAQQAAARHLALVVGTNHAVTRPFQVTGLDQVFDLHVELDAALAACHTTDSVSGG